MAWLFPNAIKQHITLADVTIAIERVPNGYGVMLYKAPTLHVLPTFDHLEGAERAYAMLIDECRKVEQSS